MTGLQQPIDPSYGEAVRDGKVIGLFISKVVPDPKLVHDTVAKGIAKNPGATWVVFETDKVAQELLAAFGVDPVLLPLNKFWKSNGCDVRRTMRGLELLLCDEVVVFHRLGSKNEWTVRAADKAEWGIHKNLYVIECGVPKAQPKRRSRKPVGA